MDGRVKPGHDDVRLAHAYRVGGGAGGAGTADEW
jgi:hypothetical protein